MAQFIAHGIALILVFAWIGQIAGEIHAGYQLRKFNKEK